MPPSVRCRFCRCALTAVSTTTRSNSRSGGARARGPSSGSTKRSALLSFSSYPPRLILFLFSILGREGLFLFPSFPLFFFSAVLFSPACSFWLQSRCSHPFEIGRRGFPACSQMPCTSLSQDASANQAAPPPPPLSPPRLPLSLPMKQHQKTPQK